MRERYLLCHRNNALMILFDVGGRFNSTDDVPYFERSVLLVLRKFEDTRMLLKCDFCKMVIMSSSILTKIHSKA